MADLMDYTMLDPGIRDAVRVVNEAGVETWQSCEGGDGHAFPEPTICISGGFPGAGERAIAALREAGYYPYQLSLVFTAPDFDDPRYQITLKGPGFETFPWWSVQARAEQEEFVRRRYVQQIENGEVSSA